MFHTNSGMFLKRKENTSNKTKKSNEATEEEQCIRMFTLLLLPLPGLVQFGPRIFEKPKYAV